MPRRVHSEALSRRHRFASPGSFEPVLRRGRKLRGDHLVLHALPAANGASRIGIALARRVAPLAVQRNQIKRVVRETFRRHSVMHDGIDCVVALRAPASSLPGSRIASELAQLLDDLHRSASR